MRILVAGGTGYIGSYMCSRKFLARNPPPEGAITQEQARALLGSDIELREYILDDYLALYAIKGRTLHLLTLRHHRQSAFPFSDE